MRLSVGMSLGIFLILAAYMTLLWVPSGEPRALTYDEYMRIW